jgi:plastocyanin
VDVAWWSLTHCWGKSIKILSKQTKIKQTKLEKENRTMTAKKIWIVGLATTVMIAMVLLAGTPSVAASDQPSGSSADVKIDNFSFGPQTLTVSVGTTVVWTNRDDIPHTVVSTDGVFKSNVRDTDEKFSFTFNKAGTYPYFCSVHPKMTGKVVVQ